MSLKEPGHASQPDKRYSKEGENDNGIDNVLYRAKALSTNDSREQDNNDNHNTLLARISKPVAIKPLQKAHNNISSADHYQYAWKPGTKSAEEAPVATENSMCP